MASFYRQVLFDCAGVDERSNRKDFQEWVRCHCGVMLVTNEHGRGRIWPALGC